MIETIVAALIVAALSGLTVVAYRHPSAYGKLYGVLAGIVGVSWIICLAFDAGYSRGNTDALGRILDLNPTGSVKTPELKSSQYWPVFFIFVPVGLLIYLSFLRVFPELGIVSKKDEKDNPEDPVS